MGYIGPAPASSFQTLAKQDFTTSATTSYTLSQSVSSANDIALFINNVRQEPTTAYSASGTALTLTEATSSSDDMYCVYLGRAVGTINPASGSVGTGELSATGTKDSTTFLRGDNTFVTPSFGKILQVQSAFKSDTASTSSTSDVAITGLSLTLTPSATSSKVLVMFDVGTAGNNSNAHFFFTPYRDIGGGGYNAIGLGTGGSSYNYASAHYATSNNNYSAFGNNFLDSPNTTSEITYKLYFRSSSGSYTSYINRRAADDVFRGASSLTCMEVGA
tara:strand:+ start:365 stop:1189 length:825 start_codon:yes stop_codon:yes gene_type:complete